MSNVIFGLLGMLWGGWIVLRPLTQSGKFFPERGVAGEGVLYAAWFFGWIILVLGGSYLRTGILTLKKPKSE